MRSSISLPKAQAVIATSTLLASSYFFATYRAHDKRAISEEEVICARGDIAYISPLPMSSAPFSAAASSSPSPSHPYDEMSEKHLQNLTKYGVTVVTKTLSPSQLVEWNRITQKEFDAHTKCKNSHNGIVWQSGRAHYHISKKSMHYKKMTRVGCNDCDDEISIEAINSSSWWGGLWRRWQRRKSSNIEKALLLQPRSTCLQDIVQSYFQQHGIPRYTLTDIQFLNAYPNSTNQIWHRDNTRRGLTAIVALCNIRDNGPTELILGSHQSKFSVWSKWWNSIQNFHREIECDGDDDSFHEKQQPPLLLGCIDAGDTLLYDARILHRGRGYDKAIYSFDDNGENVVFDRTVLVLRWDAANSPPPGAGIIVTSINAYVGSLMYASLSVLRKLTAYFKE